MGEFLPVCSGADLKLMPAPPPEAILVSVAECGKGPAALKAVMNLKKKSGAKKILMDNGMFTYHRKWQDGKKVIFDDSRPVYPKGVEMNLTAFHNAYYNAIVQPNITFITDLPTPKLPANHDPGEEEFHFMLSTYHNLIRAKEMVELHANYCPQVELYFAFQGYNVDQLIRIKKELGNLQFAGYALATRTLKWNQLVAVMMMLHHYGVRKIHILAGSNLPSMVVGAFMARHFFDLVSYDSANWLTFGLKETIRLFGSMGTVRAVEKIPVPSKLLPIRCNCPHCQERSIADIRAIPHGQYKQHLISKHNYFIEVETAKALYKHSETPAMLRDFLLSKSTRTKLILEMYDCLLAVHNMKDYFNDFKFAQGFAEFIFHQFKAR